MSVDAFATKSGMKMSSTLHSSTAIQGSITFTNKQILKVEFSVPQERVEVFSLEYVIKTFLLILCSKIQILKSIVEKNLMFRMINKLYEQM